MEEKHDTSVASVAVTRTYEGKREDKNKTFYEVQVTHRSSAVFYLGKTYTDFEEYHAKLVAKEPNESKKLSFPPKTWFAPSKKDIEARKVSFDAYLKTVLSTPALAGLLETRRFLQKPLEPEEQEAEDALNAVHDLMKAIDTNDITFPSLQEVMGEEPNGEKREEKEKEKEDEEEESTSNALQMHLVGNYITAFDPAVLRFLTVGLKRVDKQVVVRFQEDIEALARDQEDFKELMTLSAHHCINFKGSIHQTHVILKLITRYWKNEQGKFSDEQRERVVKEKIQRLVEIARETGREATKTSERIQRFADMLKEQAKVLESSKTEAEAAQKRLNSRGNLESKFYGYLGFALLPFTAPVAIEQGVAGMARYSNILRMRDKLNEELKKEISDLDDLVKVYTLLSQSYTNTSLRLKDQAKEWNDMADTVEVCRLRIGNLGRLWNNKYRREEFDELGVRIGNVEEAYGKLEEKVTNYLKELHRSGVLTIAEEVFS